MRGQATMKALAVLLTIAGLAIMVAWYGFLEPPFLSYRGLPFEPTVQEVHAGEIIPLRVTRCSSLSEDGDYLISRRIWRLDPGPNDPLSYVLPSGGLVDISPGCLTEISLANPVPRELPPGTYFIRGRSRVDGLWRTSRVNWESGPFRVLPPNGPAIETSPP